MKKFVAILFFMMACTPSLVAQKLLEAVEAKDHEAAAQYIKDGEKLNQKNKQGAFPLWAAVWNEDVRMVALLIEQGADVNQLFKAKQAKISCLEIAAQQGLVEISRLLVKGGASVHQSGHAGHTPLRIAARNGRTELVVYFLSEGSEVDSKGDDGATPLEHAASKGHLDIVTLLVEKGANVNHQDKEGDSPLGEAAKSGFAEVVSFLLSKGANPGLKNGEGRTAEELAGLAGQAKIEAMLKQHRKS